MTSQMDTPEQLMKTDITNVTVASYDLISADVSILDNLKKKICKDSRTSGSCKYHFKLKLTELNQWVHTNTILN